MSKKTKIILLSIIAFLIVVVLSVGITTAFMKPIKQGGNITEVSLSSCAKIKLEGSNSITLSNSYPMSRNKGLQTTPYTFTVTSYCDTYVGFNLYLATLSTNTLPASNIHYIITEKDSKEALAEGTLESTLDAVSEFSDAEKTELNTGLGGAYGNIYKIYNNSVPYKGSVTYDLYLFVDENVTEYQSTTFAAGVAIKSYEREKEVYLADYVKSLYAGTQGNNNIYYHDGSIKDSDGNVIDAEDNSYRYSGTNNDVNNFVCFGTNTTPCPTDNLYRVVGVFGDKVKLIKYDYATSALLGTDGDYFGSGTPDASYYKGSLTSINTYYWNKATNKNTWSESLLNKTNLNTNFITNIGTEWANKIAMTTWKVGGNTTVNIAGAVPATVYQNEIVNPVTTNTTDNATEYTAKIGLMYVSDYGFAADPSAWTTTLINYNESVNGSTIRSLNWMHMGYYDWTLSRLADRSNHAFIVDLDGGVNRNYANDFCSVRPSFNLESSVTYVSGSGSTDDPMVIN